MLIWLPIQVYIPSIGYHDMYPGRNKALLVAFWKPSGSLLGAFW
jgi:hypothetical protein